MPAQRIAAIGASRPKGSTRCGRCLGVRDPDGAAHASMPRSAAARAKVDYSLPLAQIFGLLVQLAAVEQAIWNSGRALEEAGMLAEHLARHADALPEQAAVTRFAAQGPR